MQDPLAAGSRWAKFKRICLRNQFVWIEKAILLDACEVVSLRPRAAAIIGARGTSPASAASRNLWRLPPNTGADTAPVHPFALVI